MGTVRETLIGAIRMTGARGLEDTPSAAETAMALEAFQSLLNQLPRVALTDVVISAAYTAGENERVFNTSGSPVTITLPQTVTDTVTGETRPPRNGSVVEIADATPERHIYISELGGWQEYSNLTEASAQPFGGEHEQGLRAMLAVRIAPDLQVPKVSDWVVEAAITGRRVIRQRFRQPVTITTDPLLLSASQRVGTTL